MCIVVLVVGMVVFIECLVFLVWWLLVVDGVLNVVKIIDGVEF